MEAPNFPEPAGFHDPELVDPELGPDPAKVKNVEEVAEGRQPSPKQRDRQCSDSEGLPNIPCRYPEEANDPVSFFKYRNYKVTCSVESLRGLMITTAAVFDTGASPNLIHARILPPKWQKWVTPLKHPGWKMRRIIPSVWSMRSGCTCLSVNYFLGFSST